MSSWTAFERELDAWSSVGRLATLWWRDDDACGDSMPLQRLLRTAQAHAAPVALAVIPARLDASLAHAVAPYPFVTILQHGYAHLNHAAAGERSCELGPDRPLAACIAELETGRHALTGAFRERFVSVVVPPWNRIHPHVVAALPHAGFRGLSTFGPRASGSPAMGLMQCNTHVDLVAWRSGRTFIGMERALERLVDHLAARRNALADSSEPTGLLTHHLDLADDAWSFVDELFARTGKHPAVQWLNADRLFPNSRADAVPLTSARSA